MTSLFSLSGEVSFDQSWLTQKSHTCPFLGEILAAVHAALERLDELCMQPWVPEEYLTHLCSVYEQKSEDYTRRLNGSGDEDEFDGDRQEAKLRLLQEVLTAERTAVIRLRDQGRIDDEVLRQVDENWIWRSSRSRQTCKQYVYIPNMSRASKMVEEMLDPGMCPSFFSYGGRFT